MRKLSATAVRAPEAACGECIPVLLVVEALGFRPYVGKLGLRVTVFERDGHCGGLQSKASCAAPIAVLTAPSCLQTTRHRSRLPSPHHRFCTNSSAFRAHYDYQSNPGDNVTAMPDRFLNGQGLHKYHGEKAQSDMDVWLGDACMAGARNAAGHENVFAMSQICSTLPLTQESRPHFSVRACGGLSSGLAQRASSLASDLVTRVCLSATASDVRMHDDDSERHAVYVKERSGGIP
ncbi:hypothetical protein BV25DRAFT_1831544 [Artomyces pyxidatus]|uniref:Uncharacterized protein n=1 Tax=Artomyces pyxidatus TaxID=48021 RepID=A0ACB8SKI1_9AGAM|nr:hypothetical protein BV25DRAFT_1831544 [Artomyces pyxidatus]